MLERTQGKCSIGDTIALVAALFGACLWGSLLRKLSNKERRGCCLQSYPDRPV